MATIPPRKRSGTIHGSVVVTVWGEHDDPRADAIISRFCPRCTAVSHVDDAPDQWTLLVRWLHKGASLSTPDGVASLVNSMARHIPLADQHMRSPLDVMRDICADTHCPTPFRLGHLKFISSAERNPHFAKVMVDDVSIFNSIFAGSSSIHGAIRTNNSTLLFCKLNNAAATQIVLKMCALLRREPRAQEVGKILYIPTPLNEAMVTMRVASLAFARTSPYVLEMYGARMVNVMMGNSHRDLVGERAVRVAMVMALRFIPNPFSAEHVVHPSNRAYEIHQRHPSRVSFGEVVRQDVMRLILSAQLLRHVVLALHQLQSNLGLIHLDLHLANVLLVACPQARELCFSPPPESRRRGQHLRIPEIQWGRFVKSVRIIDYASASMTRGDGRSCAGGWILPFFVNDYDVIMFVLSLFAHDFQWEWRPSMQGVRLFGSLLQQVATGSNELPGLEAYHEHAGRMLPGRERQHIDTLLHVVRMVLTTKVRVTERATQAREWHRSDESDGHVLKEYIGSVLSTQDDNLISLGGLAVLERFMQEKSGVTERDTSAFVRVVLLHALHATNPPPRDMNPNTPHPLIREGDTAPLTPRALLEDEAVFPNDMWHRDGAGTIYAL